MIMWKEILQKLIANGHLRRMPPEVWSALAEEDCRRLCEAALRNPPRTFASATLEQKNLLRSDLAQGLLPGLKYEDIGELTSDEAKILLSISASRILHCITIHILKTNAAILSLFIQVFCTQSNTYVCTLLGI